MYIAPSGLWFRLTSVNRQAVCPSGSAPMLLSLFLSLCGWNFIRMLNEPHIFLCVFAHICGSVCVVISKKKTEMH